MKEFGLIGHPVAQSRSAAYFSEKFRNEGLADHSYELYDLPSIEALPGLLRDHPHLRGFNVTIPYKRDVMRYLDDLSDEARQIGAVNCVRREADGRMVGFNTDVIGLRVSLRRFLETIPERALILGTGGASQAVQFALAELGIAFDLVSRDPARGNYTYDNLPGEAVAAAKLIVNATPLGSFPNVEEAPQIPYACVSPDHYLFDLVYNPPLTAFLDYGRQRGARICNGKEMWLEQAEAGWAIWNG